MSVRTMPSDSAPATAGRRRSASQKQLNRPQVSRNAEFATGPPSVKTMAASAVTCGSATSTIPKTSCQAMEVAGAQRLARDAMEGGMAARPCPAMTSGYARHTSPCNRNVLILSLQGHK